MGINQKITSTLIPLGLPVTADFFGGGEKEYLTFNFAGDRGAVFGDDAAELGVVNVQVHYFCPIHEDRVAMKKKIRKALIGGGFTHPSITELTEPDIKSPDRGVRHLIFECEIDYDAENEDVAE